MYYYCSEFPEVFRMPPADTVIWRYQSLARLLSVLHSRKLFFCRASKFEDRFEGAWPKQLVAKVRERFTQLGARDAIKDLEEERHWIRANMGISCWHMSEYQSAAMWKLYGLNDEGVAIKSTVGALTGALPQKQTLPGQHDDHSIFLGAVGYIDYSTAEFPTGNQYYPYMHKRQGFDFEKELRAVAMITRDAAAASAAAAGAADFEVSPGGLAIPIDVEKLIEEVYISPLGSSSFLRVVRATLDQFGFQAIPVTPSPLAEDPVY